MITQKSRLESEIEEIKRRLLIIHQDLKRLAAGGVGSPFPERQRYLEVIEENMAEEARGAIDRGMVEGCEMRGRCRDRFISFLDEGTRLSEVSGEADPVERRALLNRMREGAPFDRCDQCFSEVYRLFDRQFRVMRSLRHYRTEGEIDDDLGSMDEAHAVSSLLEPVANRQRLQILRSVSEGPSPFSRLSEITGLRGGNLLFHLNRLQEADMIVQRHERGDYLITQKGMVVLRAIARLNADLRG